MPSQHTAEFRQEAVREALMSGLSRKQVAADFSVGFSTLSCWIQLERQTLPEPTAQSDLEAEVTRLASQNQSHHMVCAIPLVLTWLKMMQLHMKLWRCLVIRPSKSPKSTPGPQIVKCYLHKDLANQR